MDPETSDTSSGEQHISPTERCLGHAIPPPANAPDATGSIPDVTKVGRGKIGRGMSTLAEIKEQWPPTVDVPTAGSVFGLSRTHSYEMVKRGEFPAKVIHVGSRYRVVTESIIHALTDDPDISPRS